MNTNTHAPTTYSLEHLSDDELHLGTRRLVGRSNQLLAGLLAHLAEVEARGIHCERACATLCTYCIYELRMSEDEASRRARASRIARQFPILFEQVAAGEIHLTGILLLGPHLTQVQFTATQEYVDLLERARGLLAHAVPSRSIEEVHLRAMRALVAELERTRMGATKTPRPTTLDNAHSQDVPSPSGDRANPRQRGAQDQANPRQRGSQDGANPRQRGRSVPRAVRRAVWERDGARCTYVDASGQRCRETGCLELDHVDPHARGGPPTIENLRLRCRPHNALTAEYEFGRDFMASKMGVEPGLL